MKKKQLIIILFLLLACAGGWFYWNSLQGKTEDAKYLVLYGNVDIRDVALGFRVAGRLERLGFEEGDRVQQGAILAELDKVPFAEELDIATAELGGAESALQNAQKLYERRKNLVLTGAVSQGAYDDAKMNYDAALARLDTAKARLAQAKTRMNDATLHAPASGIILTRVKEPGSILSAGMTVYSLALDNPVWIRTYVDEPNLGKVAPGKKAVIYTDSGGVYSGQVGFISPQAEFTPKSVETAQLRTDLVYRLRIIVDTPDQGLRQGMPVTVKIEK